MLGALSAERHGHLSSLGSGLSALGSAAFQANAKRFANGVSSVICGLLWHASWRFVASEIEANHTLAYGLPTWWVQLLMPLGFALLGFKLAARCADRFASKLLLGALLPGAGYLLAWAVDGQSLPLWPWLGLLAALSCGAPVFAVLGGLALALFVQDGQPLASVALSHYQITVNPVAACPAAVYPGRIGIYARGRPNAWALSSCRCLAEASPVRSSRPVSSALSLQPSRGQRRDHSGTGWPALALAHTSRHGRTKRHQSGHQRQRLECCWRRRYR